MCNLFINTTYDAIKQNEYEVENYDFCFFDIFC